MAFTVALGLEGGYDVLAGIEIVEHGFCEYFILLLEFDDTRVAFLYVRLVSTYEEIKESTSLKGYCRTLKPGLQASLKNSDWEHTMARCTLHSEDPHMMVRSL